MDCISACSDIPTAHCASDGCVDKCGDGCFNCALILYMISSAWYIDRYIISVLLNAICTVAFVFKMFWWSLIYSSRVALLVVLIFVNQSGFQHGRGERLWCNVKNDHRKPLVTTFGVSVHFVAPSPCRVMREPYFEHHWPFGFKQFFQHVAGMV